MILTFSPNATRRMWIGLLTTPTWRGGSAAEVFDRPVGQVVPDDEEVGVVVHARWSAEPVELLGAKPRVRILGDRVQRRAALECCDNRAILFRDVEQVIGCDKPAGCIHVLDDNAGPSRDMPADVPRDIRRE